MSHTNLIPTPPPNTNETAPIPRPDAHLINTYEVAELTGISQKDVADLADNAIIPPPVVSRPKRWSIIHILRWADQYPLYPRHGVMERLGVDSGAFARIRRRTDFPHPAITVNNRSYWWGKDIDTWADIPRCTFGARAKGKDTRCFNPQATPGPYDIADLHMCEKHLRRAQSILTRKDN